jgi:hypothetical protein
MVTINERDIAQMKPSSLWRKGYSNLMAARGYGCVNATKSLAKTTA